MIKLNTCDSAESGSLDFVQHQMPDTKAEEYLTITYAKSLCNLSPVLTPKDTGNISAGTTVVPLA